MYVNNKSPKTAYFLKKFSAYPFKTAQIRVFHDFFTFLGHYLGVFL